MLSSPHRTHSLILMALFAALTAIGAFIRIPIPSFPSRYSFFLCPGGFSPGIPSRGPLPSSLRGSGTPGGSRSLPAGGGPG